MTIAYSVGVVGDLRDTLLADGVCGSVLSVDVAYFCAEFHYDRFGVLLDEVVLYRDSDGVFEVFELDGVLLRERVFGGVVVGKIPCAGDLKKVADDNLSRLEAENWSKFEEWFVCNVVPVIDGLSREGVFEYRCECPWGKLWLLKWVKDRLVDEFGFGFVADEYEFVISWR